MAYCCLILLGKSIQKIVFGELRISEQQVSHHSSTSSIDVSSDKNLIIWFFIVIAHERQVLELHFLQVHIRVWHRKCSISTRDCPVGIMVLSSRVSSLDGTAVQGSI